jgi:site-specific recombinase XerD
MLPSINLVHRTDKKRKDGLSPIYIEAFYKGQRVRTSSGIYVKPGQFISGQIQDHPQYVALNRKLRKKIADLEASYNNMLTAGDIILKQTKSEASLTFQDYGLLVLSRQKKKLKEKTIEKYKIKFRIINEWDNKTRISQISYDWLEKLEEHLRKDKSHNTVWDYFKIVRKIVLNAVKKGLIHKNPFEDYPFPEYTDPIPTYLTKDELTTVRKYLEAHPPRQERIITAFFLLECYSGLRNGDWKQFKVEKINQEKAIKVAANKNGEPVYLYLNDSPPLKWIVEYITDNKLVYKLSLETVNRELKYLAKEWKIQKRLSSHVGRHTFGVMSAELGMPVESLAECLAISINVAKVYYTITRQKVRSEFKVWQNY